ncbi:hypothetical protein HK100_002553 [Physocladia obscura]|uniref:Uncharacterized protein n=1 Tax=Physocladia obscura TaxID=109957 RepID=A0AAD5XFB9_9FUNG|nr:hypothetical protein HK100_002553 [Physocladia obscura]
MAANGKTPRIKNAVHDAAIWRQTVHYELSTAQNWEKYWGFMRDVMILPSLNNTKFDPLPPIAAARQPLQYNGPDDRCKSGLPSRLPPGIVLPTDNPIVSDLMLTYRVPQIIRARMPVEKYRVPCTTSEEVGWIWGSARDEARAVDKDVAVGGSRRAVFHTLERFPREAYGKGDVLKWWGGGRESLP